MELDLGLKRLGYRRSVTWSDLLNRLGIRFRTRNTGVIAAFCPFHDNGQESNPSIRCWQSGRFRCHYWRCQEEGDIVDFVYGWFNVLRCSVPEWREQDIEDAVEYTLECALAIDNPAQGKIHFPST